jgi:metal-dependent HD superfamily phosphatase/phosphodiesterase
MAFFTLGRNPVSFDDSSLTRDPAQQADPPAPIESPDPVGQQGNGRAAPSCAAQSRATAAGIATAAPPDRIRLAEVCASPEVDHYLERADEILGAIGFTEHGKRHHKLCAKRARQLLESLGRPERVCELAEIAAYLHDIGNIINRNWHAQSGAQIAHSILCGMGMAIEEVTEIIAAIGHHDEIDGFPVNALSAAVIIADKSDVHRSRVRETSTINFDIHDRVNYAVTRSVLTVDTRGSEVEQAVEETQGRHPAAGLITLHLTIDTSISPVMEYFEIFLPRMILSRRAAEKLSCVYKLQVNGVEFL